MFVLRRKNSTPHYHDYVVGFTLTMVNNFRRFLIQFSTNCHTISQILFSIDGAATLKILITWQMVLLTYLSKLQGNRGMNGQ